MRSICNPAVARSSSACPVFAVNVVLNELTNSFAVKGAFWVRAALAAFIGDAAVRTSGTIAARDCTSDNTIPTTAAIFVRVA